MEENHITGQLFFRDTGKDSPNGDGRSLMMVVGILAMPDNSLSEKQIVVSGTKIKNSMDLYIHRTEGETDLTEIAKGLKVGDLLLKPIWRV